MAVPAIPSAGQPWLTWAQGVDTEARKVVNKLDGDTASVDAAVSSLVANTASSTTVELRAAFGSANPDVTITRDPATGLVSSVLEDGVLTVLTRDPVTKKVATIKRGAAPAKTVSRNTAGQATGVAA